MHQAPSHLGSAYASGPIPLGINLCTRPIPLGINLCTRPHPTWDPPMHQVPSHLGSAYASGPFYLGFAYASGPIPPEIHLCIRPHLTWDPPMHQTPSHLGAAYASGKTETIKLPVPGLPLLSPGDLPSFMLSSSPVVYNFALPIFREHFELLDRAGTKQKVLVNTFDELEFQPLRAINKYDLMGIGPLIPSALLDYEDPSDTSFGAFGSFSQVLKLQMEEIAKGLLKTHKPFLWVIKAAENGEKLEDRLSCKQELEKQGMIVQWCSQLEVLSHSSVGCFLTNCGWNSIMESLVSGVPVVGFPQWTDQLTNAKLVQYYWKTGLRVQTAASATGDGGIVMADEIARCLEIVMGSGERGEEMRKQAQKWINLAKEAVKESGSSNVNIKVFMDEIVGGSN
ncbi:UDP-glycosyltransferase 75D1 [Abeliophyllum distichum]|uniref:UDP-glycosyltransferase 75D1 n=1 Tax=Abeliophyllum distichum TaxID=126358 RepID=A0ABD1T0Z1_9LAMI